MNAATDVRAEEITARTRAALAYRGLSAPALSRILEVSPAKARRLYHGRDRTGYTLSDLAILSAYFGVSLTAWFGPLPWIALHDPDAEDRAFTARELLA